MTLNNFLSIDVHIVHFDIITTIIQVIRNLISFDLMYNLGVQREWLVFFFKVILRVGSNLLRERTLDTIDHTI